ncbi:MAG: DUF1512 domain-containing protein [Candidatus Korarchaeota archaeon]|nr:DUF1512 domain-containing protein [Candidatus Korarchaeota archaeon]NIU85148.1 DUF1512 domain-containing protein [Candidatus Thorarchaeota archaeon]NIW15200.1 DUF1512 domain-containing protein [Candidatus Thorarchaeota archaeon]NIW53181.1 DUF1512 domain-containing protein [Candidatus Korarchaeota archaeon]
MKLTNLRSLLLNLRIEQLFNQTDGGIMQIIWWILFFFLIFGMNFLRVLWIQFKIKNFIEELENIDNLAFWKLIAKVTETKKEFTEIVHNKSVGEAAENLKENEDFKATLRWARELRDSFTISPVERDPTDVLKRLEHIFDVRQRRMRGIASRIVPDAPEHVKRNIEGLFEVSASLHQVYKLIRHIYKVAQKIGNIYYLMQVSMVIPFIREQVVSVFDAEKGFRYGIPIGDGVGAMVAETFFGDEVTVNEELDTVYSPTEYEGRYVLAIKAKGPGSEVGKPGQQLQETLEQLNGEVDGVITVDAALRLEGEENGKVDLGVGAAIGGTGVEKWKMEEICRKYETPLYAVAIKESIPASITPMEQKLLKGVDKATEEVKRLIREEIPEEGKAIILGIGNTVGVGNE